MFNVLEGSTVVILIDLRLVATSTNVPVSEVFTVLPTMSPADAEKFMKKVASHVHLKAGDVLWIPPGVQSMLIATEKKAPTVSVWQPYFMQDGMKEVLGNELATTVISWNKEKVSQVKDSAFYAKFYHEFEGWAQ